MTIFDFPEDRVVVTTVTSDEDLKLAFDVRLVVFVEEQQVPVEEEIDALDADPTTTHVLARDADTGLVLGTARLLPTIGEANHFHIGRVAVTADARGRNVGAALMRSLERVATTGASMSDGPVIIELSAQIQASGFYRKLGYAQVSEDEYLDAGILHVDMSKTISELAD